MKSKLKHIFFIFVLLILLSNSCYAVTIVLDPGHGGADTGAINKNLGLYERNQVWKIANYLKAYLEEYSDTSVYLTCPTLRTTGTTISREERANIMNQYNADLAISLHIDSSTSSKLNGSTAYITKLPKYNSSMTKLGNMLLNNLSKLGIKSNGIKVRPTESNDGYYSDGTPYDYYGIIRFPTLFNIPIVLLEHCYISNANDCKYIDSDEDLQRLARADADAIVSYLDLKLPTKTVTGIKIDTENINLLEKGTSKINVEVEPSNAENKDIKFTSSDESIVKVDDNGNITGVTLGEATITVTSVSNPEVSKNLTVNVVKLEDTKYEIKQYTITNNKISKIGPTVKINDFMKNISVSDGLKVTINPVTSKQDIIGTNTKVLITDKKYNIEIANYDCLIYGDVNGDGEIDAVDYTLIKNDIMDVKKLTDTNMKLTADVNGDGEIDAVDYTLIKNDIMDVKKLTLK